MAEAEDRDEGADPEAAVAALIEATIAAASEHLDRSHGEIARGGMASVELAVDRTLGRRVALKLIHEDFQRSQLAVHSFIREAQVTGQLDHPNIVPVHELAVDADGRLFFTMKLVEGRTLLALIDELRAGHDRYDAHGRTISTTIEHEDLLHMIEVFIRVLDAVAFAHSRGVVHCDIKSENVMVGDYGEVYLMDWGIAKILPPRPNEAAHAARARVHDELSEAPDTHNLIMGTPAYMSPEQARGARDEVDERSDIFALGAMLFEILTGHPPYQGDDAQAELELARACEVVLLPHLAIVQELRRIVAKATAPEPSQRYASVDQFRAELRGFMRGGDNFPRRRFAKGEWLIREGEVGDAAYILVSGRCEVCKKIDGKRQPLRTIGPGEVFGETSILAASKRTASVIALTEVVVVIVTAEVLEREVDAMKPWMGAFIGALARRFSDVETRVLEQSKTGPDPVQVANLALMTLKTWGRRSREHGLVIGAIQLCESIAKITGLRESAVLKILGQYSQFEIMLTHDLIALRDDRGLAEELLRFLKG